MVHLCYTPRRIPGDIIKYIYNANGFDIALVQRLLQHSSAATTQRYIGIEPQKIEQAIQNHAQLIWENREPIRLPQIVRTAQKAPM